MSDELKPCPFCGFERPHFMEEGHWIYMACESCGCGGPVSTQMRDPSDNWNTRPLEDALRAELAAKDAEIARLNNLLADAISTAREGVVELLDALHADEITQQEVIDSFRQYLLGNAETRICSYCGLLMSGDKAQQMTSHVMQCASNPLVQEIARLKERLTILNTLINDVY